MLTEVTRTLKHNAGWFSHDDLSQCLSFTSEGRQLWYKLRFEKNPKFISKLKYDDSHAFLN